MSKRSSQDAYDPGERNLWLHQAKGAIQGEQVFIHYKGGVYMIERSDVTHTETEEVGVVYRHLWPHRDDRLWFRPQEMFFDQILDEGKLIDRFERVDFERL